MANWSDTKMDDLWLGDSGSISFGDLNVTDIGVFKKVVDVMKSLPFLEVDQVSHWKGSQVLRIDRSRRIF